jgi:hypothetical protein
MGFAKAHYSKWSHLSSSPTTKGLKTSKDSKEHEDAMGLNLNSEENKKLLRALIEFVRMNPYGTTAMTACLALLDMGYMKDMGEASAYQKIYKFLGFLAKEGILIKRGVYHMINTENWANKQREEAARALEELMNTSLYLGEDVTRLRAAFHGVMSELDHVEAKVSSALATSTKPVPKGFLANLTRTKTAEPSKAKPASGNAPTKPTRSASVSRASASKVAKRSSTQVASKLRKKPKRK